MDSTWCIPFDYLQPQTSPHYTGDAGAKLPHLDQFTVFLESCRYCGCDQFHY
jgi:hypothetical protein